ncbi:ead/Ea22-like family protein, partial [Escherichia coli]|nr:ead/Ea22-like family protein [Escherichia coli]
MSKIDYQKLREIAEKTKIAGEAPVMPFDQRINALNDFMKHFSPDIALALLDERERNQQYIKRRDQENEEIALTVGKLRVELEAAENNLIDSECHVAELEEALRDKQALLEASEKRIAELRDWNAGLAQESLTYQQRVAELESNEVREDGNQFLVVRHPGKTPVIKHCTGDLEEFLRKLIEQDPLVTIDIITHRYYGIGGQWVQDAVEYLHMMSDA